MAEPMYRQIAEDLRERIASGEFAPGSKLPTELELREHYNNASRNTIRDAIGWLSNRRLVVAQPGRGTFVVEKLTPFIVPLAAGEKGVGNHEGGVGGDEGEAFNKAVRLQGGEPRMGDPRVEIRKATSDLARELHIETGAQVVSRHQQRFIDGRPSSLQTSFYPMEFVQRGAVDLLQATDIPQGATKYVGEKLGIKPTGYRDRVTVRPPDASETAFFRFPDAGNVVVMVVRRTAYTTGAKPIRFTVTAYPADRNHFVIDSGETPPLDEIVREL